MKCTVCGDTYESDDVQRVLRWDASHRDSCPAEEPPPRE